MDGYDKDTDRDTDTDTDRGEERRIQIGVCIYDNGIQQLLVSDIKLRLEKFGENLDLYY